MVTKRGKSEFFKLMAVDKKEKIREKEKLKVERKEGR